MSDKHWICLGKLVCFVLPIIGFLILLSPILFKIVRDTSAQGLICYISNGWPTLFRYIGVGLIAIIIDRRFFRRHKAGDVRYIDRM
jgi:hypothetical protein